MISFDSITTIKGIGQKRAQSLSKLEISSVRDLLFHFPRTYHIYPDFASKLINNMPIAICSSLINYPTTKKTKNMIITLAKTVYLENEIDLVWFRMPYIKNKLKTGYKLVFYGIIKENGPFRWKIEQAEIFTIDEYSKIQGKMLPIYPLTKGITNNNIVKSVNIAINNIYEDIDYLPYQLLKKRNLLSLKESIALMHFPSDEDKLIIARNRLVYDEFLMFFIQMYESKSTFEGIKNLHKPKVFSQFEKVINNLPFELTNGQKDAINDIKNDFISNTITQRLIQGDVGSGKTIIAFLAMLIMAENGYQSALMAPTEVLASQHLETFNSLIEEHNLPYEAVLLTGSMNLTTKREVRKKIKDSRCSFIIGTHAIIQDSVDYNQLALVITDEQHRFGVKQRKKLANKGIDPSIIVMSATPIPRTLALILYSDMNVSMIKDVPKTKLPIKNCVINDTMRTKAYQMIMREINAGHQAYIICPLVEATEKTEAENVTEYANMLREILPSHINIGLLHGKMNSEQKNVVMNDFSKNALQILVSTTVIEVGVNVPNATVIMIENANRFGLAQLHQLRGRVGRGAHQSYCILMDSGVEPSKRLEVLNNSNDGFYIANEDLKLRGPGDFYGIRQSGDFRFNLADIYNDSEIMQIASNDAKRIVEGQYKDMNFDDLYEYINLMAQNSYDNL